MGTARKALGALAILLGIVGALLSIAGLVGAWWVKQPVLERSREIFQSLDNSLVYVTDKVEQGKGAVSLLQQETTNINRFVGTLVDDINAKSVEDLQAMEKRIKTQLQVATLLLRAGGVKLKPLGKSFRLVDEAPMLTLGEELDDPGLTTHVSEAGQHAQSANDREEELRTIISELQNGRNVKQNLTRLREVTQRLDADIREIGTRLNRADQRIGVAKGKLEKLRTSFPGWWSRVVLIVTFSLIWIALAQICLTLCGRALLRSRAQSEATAG